MDYSSAPVTRRPATHTTVSDFAKRPVGTAGVRDDYPPCQRISAQSPARPDATISRLDPPCPRVGGLLPQALVSGLQHLEVERIACDSSRRPAGNLPERLLPPAAPCRKSNGPPFRADSDLAFNFGASGVTGSVGPEPRSLIALTPRLPRDGGKFHHAIGRTQFDPPLMRFF